MLHMIIWYTAVLGGTLLVLTRYWVWQGVAAASAEASSESSDLGALALIVPAGGGRGRREAAVGRRSMIDDSPSRSRSHRTTARLLKRDEPLPPLRCPNFMLLPTFLLLSRV